MAGERRLTIVQYAGDFAEASKRLSQGGPETYRAQRYTVEYVEGLAERLDAVTTITAFTDDRYDEVLPSGARAIGAGYANKIDYGDLTSLIASTQPQFLVLRSPLLPLLHWAARHRIRTLALLADSFNASSLKGRLRQVVLTHYLNSTAIDWVANHGLNSSEQLAAAGVKAAKVVPWDFPALDSPDQNPPKPNAASSPKLVYVGLLSEAKGLFDLIDAVGLLSSQGLDISATLIGKGDDNAARARIAALGLDDRVTLAGLVANDQIIPTMRCADVVVVPSRHAYPEGMPLTIYEALCSRTPLVASDHPMFMRNIQHEVSALIFPAGDAKALAQQVQRLVDDPALYARLSASAPDAWRRLQLPVIWDRLIDAWIRDDVEARRWLSDHSLMVYDYSTS